jgi:dTDP-4-amino-4,6-dideoxygalactose transaminase
MINVTKTFLPPFEEYTAILKRAWDKGWITNNGELVQELEAKLKDYLGTEHLLFCSNGTIVLQMAIKALGLTKEVITTPFSYVATTNAILWEGCRPVFVDIETKGFGLDPKAIEAAITPETEAILTTLVYGFPGQIDALEDIADRHGIKLIIDGAHAFGCSWQGRSLLSFGHVATTSFHATKVFHTVEGGAMVTSDSRLNEKLRLMRQFGHQGDDYIMSGINAKNSEFHAAMGIAVLPQIDRLIFTRRDAYECYLRILGGAVQGSNWVQNPHYTYNYSYCPILFKSEVQLIACMDRLAAINVFPRRYFWPALNTLPYLSYQPCPVAEDIASRILTLPLYPGIELADVEKIGSTVLEFL